MKKLLFAIIPLTALIISTPSLAADGKEIYQKTCAGCHNGLNPKLGDKAEWEPRIMKGKDALVTSALNGKGGMPAKGGNAALSEDDIRAAVDYIVSQVK
jgi:cytochrome c5